MKSMNKSVKQSNFELLKIISMFFIVLHHFVVYDVYDINTQVSGITLNKFLLQFLGNQAFIANNIFFMISAWFLCDASGIFEGKKVGLRIWKLERQMLFYSLLFGVVSLFTVKDWLLMVKSLLPLTTGLWWYPSSYAFFLLFQPFYQKMLLKCSKQEMKWLIGVMIGIWSIPTLLPTEIFELGANNTTCFFMLYAIIFYIKKWHMDVLNYKKIRWLLLISYILVVISIVALDFIGKWVPSTAQSSAYYIRADFRFFPVVISVCIFLCSVQWKIQSNMVNILGGATFGVYLIHMYPTVAKWLLQEHFNLEPLMDKPYLIAYVLGVVVLIYMGCSILEWVRQVIFRFTFDRIGKEKH